jgi:hypothetical protein
MGTSQVYGKLVLYMGTSLVYGKLVSYNGGEEGAREEVGVGAYITLPPAPP